jgi:hypothetical protein
MRDAGTASTDASAPDQAASVWHERNTVNALALLARVILIIPLVTRSG